MDIDTEKQLNQKFIDFRIINEDEKIVIKEKVNVLLKQNEELLKTVDIRILTSEYDDISNLLNVLTVYPDIQNKIVNLSYSKYKLFSAIVRNMDEMNVDWIGITEELIDNLARGTFDDLFLNSQMQRKVDELYSKNNVLTEKNKQELAEITWVLTNPKVCIPKTYKELKNINLNKRFNDILMGKEKNTEFNKLSKTEKIKDMIFQKKFGHGIDFANTFFERYADDYEEIIKIIENESNHEIYKYVNENIKLSNIEDIKHEVLRIKTENETIKEYLKALKNVIEMEDIDKLQQYYATIKSSKKENISYNMDSFMRKFFCREKNKGLYKLKDEDKTKINNRTVYVVKNDFKMSMTSLLSYSEALDLDCKLVENHGNCTTPIANNNLGTAPIRGACLGFTGYDERSLLASSPWDLASNRFAMNFNIAKAEVKENDYGKPDIKFHLPNSQINRIRRRHGEDIYERRELDETKIDFQNEKFKKQPSYVVYFSETDLSNYIDGDMLETLTSENLRKYLNESKFNDFNYRTKLIEQYAQNDELWKYSIEESEKRNVDIAIVDRTYIALKERLKIDEIEKSIMETSSEQLNDPAEMDNFLNMIENLIVESENNRAGNSLRNGETGQQHEKLVHEEIREKLFSKEIMEDRLNKIEAKLQTFEPEKAKLCYERLKKVTLSEIEKYKHAYFENDPGYDLESYLRHFIGKQVEGQDMNIQNLLNEIDSRTGRTGGEIVCNAIEDIKELQEYEASSAAIHGRKHINNVILFSYLIAKNEGILNSNNLDLLMQAAKFHDVGRDGNWNGQGDGYRHDYDEIKHAEPSSMAAEFYLSKETYSRGVPKYSKEQIAMVQVAIHYHEVHEKNRNEFNEEVFDKLCSHYGVREEDREVTKLISIYLKDADAVDRTRFMQESHQEDIENIPEHERYKRRFADNLNISFLRRPSSILLVNDARKMHKELLKRGCEYVFDAQGNFVNDIPPETMLLSILEPYQELAKSNPRPKYTTEDNKIYIKEFLEQKHNESLKKEKEDLMKIYQMKDKSLLAKLRKKGKDLLQRLFRSNSLER